MPSVAIARWAIGRVATGHMSGTGALLRPHIDAAGGTDGGQRVESRLRRAPIEDLGVCLLFRPADRHRLAGHESGRFGGGIGKVSDDDRLSGTDDHTCRFETDVEAMGAKIALLGGLILGVDEDGVVGAGGDAGLAPDAAPLVEIDDPVSPLVHRRRGAGSDARRVLALIATGHLVGPAGVREDSLVDVLHVRPRHAQRHVVLRLAGRRTGVAPDAAGLVQHLDPARQRRPAHAARPEAMTVPPMIVGPMTTLGPTNTAPPP